MGATIALTEARIKTALATALPKLEVRLYDTKVPGLLLWRRPSGRPRWYVFRRAGGRMRRVVVGEINDWPTVPLEQARTLAVEVIAQLAGGQDPVKAKAERRAMEKGGLVPLSEALERHLALLKERGRSEPHQHEVKRVVEEAIAAGVKDLAAEGIAAKAATWLERLDVSDQTRHRYRVHLIAVGKTAVRWWPPKALPREPFAALSGEGAPMPAPPVFDLDEACAFASDEAIAMESTGGRLWAFLLYSGCRYKEGAWARWDRIDLKRSTYVVIPPDAAEHAAGMRVKRGKSRTVALQAELIAILETWPRDPSGFLFPSIWRDRPHTWNVWSFRDHLKALEIELDGRRIHALRHTHACLAIASGEDSLRLRLSMGHAGEVMQQHYASKAMRWRGLLAGWEGIWKLRDPDEVKRLTARDSRDARSA